MTASRRLNSAAFNENPYVAFNPGGVLKREIMPPNRPRSPFAAVPAFAVVGLIGFVVDSSVTYGLARAGWSLALARPPGVILATMVNFALNRRFTFQATHLPIVAAFLRYVAVTSLGAAVNYLTYLAALALGGALGMPTTPEVAPLYIAAGVGAAMLITFEGFRRYAFRDRGR